MDVYMIVQKKLKYQDNVSCEEVNEIAFLDVWFIGGSFPFG